MVLTRALVVAILAPLAASLAAGADPPPDLLIGYTELRTDRPG